jgi:transposase-like protein
VVQKTQVSLNLSRHTNIKPRITAIKKAVGLTKKLTNLNMKCPLCDSTELQKYGETRNGVLKYQCHICSHIFTSDLNRLFDAPQINFIRLKKKHLDQNVLRRSRKFFGHLNRIYFKSILLFTILAVILLYLTPLHGGENPSMMQAKELLLGKPYLPEKISWIEMLEWEGHYYIAYPPMVTFLSLPYVLLNGAYLGGEAINSIMIFGSSIFMFLLVKNLKEINQWASLSAIAYVVGTVNLHSAKIGSIWLLMHSFGNFFFLLSLWLFLQKRSYFWAGLSFAIAFQVRYLILAAIIIFPLYSVCYFRPISTISQWQNFVLGLLPPCIMTWAFQWWTLGNPFTSPYTIAWQQWGITESNFSLSYLPHNFQIYFLEMPKVLNQFPYLHFELEGQAMWVISPFLLGVLFLNFRQRFVWSFFPSTALMLIGYLCYRHTGFTQYGTRYAQDIFPVLIPLAFTGFNHRKLSIRKLLPIAVLISCIINIYAVLFALKSTWG